jgi:hypothetical protein
MRNAEITVARFSNGKAGRKGSVPAGVNNETGR